MRARISSQRFISLSSRADFRRVFAPRKSAEFHISKPTIAGNANEYGGLRQCPMGDLPISTVFSTGVENFGERPNAAWKIACGVDSKQKEADCNTLPRRLTPTERVR